MNYNVSVQKLRGDHLWGERCPGILKYNADNVITNMSFSPQLLLLSCAKVNNQKTQSLDMIKPERKKRTYVEHYLIIVEDGKDCFGSSLIVFGVETSRKSLMSLQSNYVS